MDFKVYKNAFEILLQAASYKKDIERKINTYKI